MDLQLTGKTAFISGSTQGIGYAVARMLAGEGVAVTLHGRTAAKVAAAVETLQREVPGAAVDGAAADFAVPGDVERLCTELAEVDILINNAGLFDLQAFDEISADEWRRYFEVNTLSGVLLARRLMPGMLERRWGRIVFISSESGVNVPADMIHYGATKAAMMAVGNGLAKLTRSTGVTVNSVLGGPTYSDGVAATVEGLAASTGQSVDAMKQAIIGANRTSLLERFIEPEEIAALVAFLASPRASATNGAAVRVDGGVLTTVV